MNIQSTRRAPSLPVSKPEPKEGFWDELFSGELNEIGIHLNPEYIDTTIDGAHSLGEGLRKTWNDLSEKIARVFDIDGDQSTFSPEFREKATRFIVSAAKGVGYLAAGVQGVGGLYKLGVGIKEKNLGKKLDGVFDLSTSAAVATTIAGMGVGPLVLGPVAAVMGIVRGGYNATRGFLEGNARKEIQGALDASRAGSVGLRLASSYSTALGVAGSILGAMAGAIQITRGYYDLSSGLAQENKEKQMQGLTDIASATGLTMALTGIGTIPGIAITALAMGSRLLYQFNDRFESYSNRKLEKWNPGLKRAVKTVDAIAMPVLRSVRDSIEHISGRNHGEEGKKQVQNLPEPLQTEQ